MPVEQLTLFDAELGRQLQASPEPRVASLRSDRLPQIVNDGFEADGHGGRPQPSRPRPCRGRGAAS